jgi:hypothetical protein
MSVSNHSTNTIVEGSRALLSSTFLEFCANVRKDDPSFLPEPGQPLTIRNLSETENIELADALLENTNATYLQLRTAAYTKSSAEAIAKYVRTSKCLKRICWPGNLIQNARELEQHEEILCCFLPAFQASTSLKELHMELPIQGGPSNLALENMLAHPQSLRSLRVVFPVGPPEDMAMAAVRSGFKKKTLYKSSHWKWYHTGNGMGCKYYLLDVEQSVRTSFPSKALFAWVWGGCEWTRGCVAK